MTAASEFKQAVWSAEKAVPGRFRAQLIQINGNTTGNNLEIPKFVFNKPGNILELNTPKWIVPKPARA